jgi:hypothetical protein
MASSPVESILAQVKALSPEEQVEVAEALDRLTWARRWRKVCERIEENTAKASAEDREIDDEVRAVRQEKPLSERSSTRPS